MTIWVVRRLYLTLIMVSLGNRINACAIKDLQSSGYLKTSRSFMIKNCLLTGFTCGTETWMVLFLQLLSHVSLYYHNHNDESFRVLSISSIQAF